MSKKVVVCAVHSIIGRVFWKYTYEGDVNMPDCFGLTTDISSAVVLDTDWRMYQDRITEDFIYNIDFDKDSFKINIMGSSGITTEAFISWAYMY